MEHEVARPAEAVLRLPGQATSASEVRWFVQAVLGRWGLLSEVEVATLLASELAANSVRHAHSPLEVRLWRADDSLRVGIVDHCPAHPVLRRPRPEEEQGRGLLLIEELASAWGVADCRPGKCVWFEVR